MGCLLGALLGSSTFCILYGFINLARAYDGKASEDPVVSIAFFLLGFVLICCYSYLGAKNNAKKKAAAANAADGNAFGKFAKDSTPTPEPAQLTCPNCGAMAPAGQAFCGSCGQRLAPAPEPPTPGPTPQPEPTEKVCPRCGYKQALTQVFCENCGERL